MDPSLQRFAFRYREPIADPRAQLPDGTATPERVDALKTAGKERRAGAPRSAHAGWEPPKSRTDPLSLLEAQNKHRLPQLVPLRWARLAASPFAFLRGAAVVMAEDLAGTPNSGITVQACGDAHLANYGVFASPERDLLFDVNDFDETMPGPWEWDVKRLAASAVVAGRDAGLNDATSQGLAQTAIAAYHDAARYFATLNALDTWYSKVDEASMVLLRPGRSRQDIAKLFSKARAKTSATAFPSLVELTRAGDWRIVDHPPVVSHDGIADRTDDLLRLYATYRDSVSDDRRRLLERFDVRDFALKVVGVGSVGTRCFVALLESDVGEPLFLQVKEADASALAPYLPPTEHESQGRRVVAGQRIMQADSDIFLGWAQAAGDDYYVRQLRDQKGSADFTAMRPGTLRDYLDLCGWTLARAHARNGAAAAIAGYLGKAPTFVDAVTKFAVGYADQTRRDHAALVDAIRQGRIQAAKG